MNWCPLENHDENSGHPVKYYCRCPCLGSRHMVIVRLVLQPTLCGIGCRQILEMRCLLKIRLFSHINNYYHSNLLLDFIDILFRVSLYGNFEWHFIKYTSSSSLLLLGQLTAVIPKYAT